MVRSVGCRAAAAACSGAGVCRGGWVVLVVAYVCVGVGGWGGGQPCKGGQGGG